MAKIVVLVKQVPDVSQVKFEGGRAPNLAAIQAKMSDADKNALEAAAVLKAAHAGSEVTVATVGGAKAGEMVNEALAIAGDKAVIVTQPNDGIDARATAQLLAAAIKKAGACDLVLCGEASTDAYQSQVGPRVAELLNVPQITFAKTVAIEGNAVVASRDLGDTEQKVKAEFPALVAVVKDANTPRLPNIMAIMNAKKKPRQTWKASDLGMSEADFAPDKLAVSAVEMRAQTMARKMEVIKDKPVEEAAARVVEELQKRAVLKGGR
jgi:electron transfer flavoprotein beta subunit